MTLRDTRDVRELQARAAMIHPLPLSGAAAGEKGPRRQGSIEEAPAWAFWPDGLAPVDTGVPAPRAGRRRSTAALGRVLSRVRHRLPGSLRRSHSRTSA